MAGDRTEGMATPDSGGIAAELAAAGFANASEVGRGGAGVVYRCYETALGRNIAIKVLLSHLDGEGRERFLRESYAMGGLSGHPNIVNILRVGVTSSNRPYIAMPYNAADSLAVRLRREGSVPWPEALRIGVKLCGALETAHKTGTLHRDIKPANVLVNDYGEPQLSDFGIAHIQGGYETVTGFFSGTIDFMAPEVLAGNPATVAADVYSLGATIYALIAGKPAHQRTGSEDLIAHYLRISSTEVPDMRPEGIPDTVCTAIENAMALDPAKRPESAADFGRELQAAQRRNGLKPDSMAVTGVTSGAQAAVAMPAGAPSDVHVSEPPSVSPAGDGGSQRPRAAEPGPTRHTAGPAPFVTNQLSDPSPQPGAPVGWGPPAWSPPGTQAPQWSASEEKKRNRAKVPLIVGALVVVLLLVASGVFFVLSREPGTDKGSASPPSTEAQAGWQPITNARIAREAAATTQADGTIWIFGGLGSDGVVSTRHEGYDPVIDNWKGGDDLPVPIQHAMAVTWMGTPVVLGGWRTAGANKVATDQVWRVVNGQWTELPHMLQPRAAAAAAVVGDRIVVTGGVDARGALLNTTEIFDGTSWTLGAPIPTPRQLLAAASDAKLVYVTGGTTGDSDLATVEAYDPAANTWTSMPDLPEARSDLGVAVADGRMAAVGGVSSGTVLKSAVSLDLTSKTWAALPDLATPRHGMAVAAVGKSVYAIGGATEVGDSQVSSSAEALKLAPRRVQPASEWRSLPDASTARLMMAWTVLDGKIWIIGGLTEGNVLPTVESYDPQNRAWRLETPLPIALHHATAATYRGEVVVIGGTTDNIAQASNKVFALRGGAWAELPPLQHARAAAAAAVVGDKLVVVGGQNAKQIVPQTEVFDGQSWNQAPDMPNPREHLAAVSDGTYVYAIGGRFLSADKNSAAFDRFDPESGKWTSLVEMPTPRGSYGATFIDGRIVAVGGEEPTQVLGAAEMYDIGTGKWTKLPPLPTPRHAEVVAAVGSTVYCIGGANRPTHEGAVATIEALDFK
jgi:serine/threonine-protein kinase PknK